MDGKVDLDAVEDYLNSDLAPANTMDLSELDGFLTGVALSQATGTVKFTSSATTWTASGGSIPAWCVPFKTQSRE